MDKLFFCTLSTLPSDATTGRGGPSPSWLPRPLPRSRFPAGSHRGPGGDLHAGVPAPAGTFRQHRRRARCTPPSGPRADFSFDLRLEFRVAPARMAPRAPATPPERSPGRGSPQPLLALLRGELVEGLGVLLAQEGLVVVLEALVVLGRPLAQLRVGPHHALLAHRGLGPQRPGSQRQHQQQRQGQSQAVAVAPARHREERAAGGEAPSERQEKRLGNGGWGRRG